MVSPSILPVEDRAQKSLHLSSKCTRGLVGSRFRQQGNQWQAAARSIKKTAHVQGVRVRHHSFCCNHLPTDLAVQLGSEFLWRWTLRGGVGHHGHGAALGSLQGSGLIFVLRLCASGCRSPCQLTACHSNPQLLRDGHGWLQ